MTGDEEFRVLIAPRMAVLLSVPECLGTFRWTPCEDLSQLPQTLAANPYDAIVAAVESPADWGWLDAIRRQGPYLPVLILGADSLLQEALARGAQALLPPYATPGQIARLLWSAYQSCQRAASAERELKELRCLTRTQRALAEYAPDAGYVNDAHGRLVDVNHAAESLTGYSRVELVGKTFFELGILLPEDLPRAAARLALVASGKNPGPQEYTLVRKDGSLVPIEIASVQVPFAEGPLIAGSARDISLRRRAQEEARQSVALLERILATNLAVIFVATLTGAISYISDNVSQVLGYPACRFTENPRSAELSSAYSVGEIPTLEGLAIHQESSLGLLPVTEAARAARLAGLASAAKRRQSERQTVTKVKLNEPRNENPGADSIVVLEGYSRRPYWQGLRRPRRGRSAWYAPNGYVGNSGEPTRPRVEYANRMSVYLRNANAVLEVGPTDSTPSAGKPCTWGSGGASGALFGDTSSALRGGE